MSAIEHVFLIPGFFGFANLGELRYFAHVVEVLSKALGRHGVTARVHAVTTHPTASIRRRAEILLEQIVMEAGKGERPIHLVGHSTGGLDARLLVSPGANLASRHELEPIARRVESVVMVACPNHGTPLANFFLTVMGKHVLRVLSLATMYIIRFGHLPLSALLKLGALLLQLDSRLGFRKTILNQLFEQLLADYSTERQRAIKQFLAETGQEQALLNQLTPEGIDLLNASSLARVGCRYGSVVTATPGSGVRSSLAIGLNPYGQATLVLFELLRRVTSRYRASGVPALDAETSARFMGWLGFVPTMRDNDGIVPTLSQICGEVIHATRGDHLDVVGHFCATNHEPPHYDWLASGSLFDLERFERLWDAVAEFIAR